MKAGDYGKALAVALGLIILNFAIGFGAVFVYSIAIEPGHDQAFYRAAALRIVPWAVGIVAPLLFLGAGYLFAIRKPERSGLAFAAAFSALYILLDGAVSALMGQLAGFLSLANALHMAGHIAAAIIGAHLASARRSARVAA